MLRSALLGRAVLVMGTTALLAGCGDVGMDADDAMDVSSGVATNTDAAHGKPAKDDSRLVGLLDEVEGWATGVKGGMDGNVYVVTNTNDSGDRSLRAALESSSKVWIVFDDKLDGATITLKSTVNVKGYKTIDGRGVNIRIRTNDPGEFSALRFRGQSHLIINNVTFDDEYSKWDTDGEPGDGLEIEDSSYVWVHKCRFRRWKDGAIDIRHEGGALSKNISVTWSKFEETYQALNWTGDAMSFGHNYCYKVRTRCIKVIVGKAHSWNNVIYDWNGNEVQNAKDGAQLFSEFNIFHPQSAKEVNKFSGGCIKNAKHMVWGGEDVSFQPGCDSIATSFISDSKAGARRTKCSDDDCWKELYNDITTKTGPTY